MIEASRYGTLTIVCVVIVARSWGIIKWGPHRSYPLAIAGRLHAN